MSDVFQSNVKFCRVESVHLPASHRSFSQRGVVLYVKLWRVASINDRDNLFPEYIFATRLRFSPTAALSLFFITSSVECVLEICDFVQKEIAAYGQFEDLQVHTLWAVALLYPLSCHIIESCLNGPLI